jgi:hypothetical protein
MIVVHPMTCIKDQKIERIVRTEDETGMIVAEWFEVANKECVSLPFASSSEKKSLRFGGGK